MSLGSSHQQSNNADLTPRIVREGVSGVISAQWSSLHWMEAVLLSFSVFLVWADVEDIYLNGETKNEPPISMR